MATIRFEWKCSYQDMREYRAYGHTSIRTIETYNGQPHMLEYIGSWYNGTKEQFQADIIARQHGAAIRYREGHNTFPYRWTAAEYSEFVEYLRACHAEDVRVTEDFRQKYPEVKYDEVAPFNPPRPIYWDNDAKTWATEDFEPIGELGMANLTRALGMSL